MKKIIATSLLLTVWFFSFGQAPITTPKNVSGGNGKRGTSDSLSHKQDTVYYFSIKDLQTFIPLLLKQTKMIGWNNLSEYDILNYWVEWLNANKRVTTIPSK